MIVTVTGVATGIGGNNATGAQTFDAGELITATATCTGATPRIIGGGVSASQQQSFQISQSFPNTTTNTWTATAVSFDNDAPTTTITVYAICIP